jgi:hypothetical protein
MNLFRSEEHVRQFNETRSLRPGETIPAAKMCELANAWWGNRLASNWRPRTPEESQAILDGVGLTDPFWRLSG